MKSSFALLLFLAVPVLYGDEVKSYECHKIDHALNINGKIDDAAWQFAPWTDNFIDIEGAAKTKPRFRTRMKMLWDQEYFYLAAELEEPHVWATLTKHDSVIFHDNDFEVFIDPDGDTLNYYEFEINALNTSWDLLLNKPYRLGGSADNSWEIPGLKSAVHVDGTLNNTSDTDKGWTVEIALPWKALAQYANKPSPPQAGDTWRANFSRVEWQDDIVNGKYEIVPHSKEDNWVWSSQGEVNMHIPERWGKIHFVAK